MIKIKNYIYFRKMLITIIMYNKKFSKMLVVFELMSGL